MVSHVSNPTRRRPPPAQTGDGASSREAGTHTGRGSGGAGAGAARTGWIAVGLVRRRAIPTARSHHRISPVRACLHSAGAWSGTKGGMPIGCHGGSAPPARAGCGREGRRRDRRAKTPTEASHTVLARVRGAPVPSRRPGGCAMRQPSPPISRHMSWDAFSWTTRAADSRHASVVAAMRTRQVACIRVGLWSRG